MPRPLFSILDWGLSYIIMTVCHYFIFSRIIPEKIVCETSAVPSIKKRSVRQGFVKVVIDNIELTNDDLVFTYEENPYVTNVSPRRTIAR